MIVCRNVSLDVPSDGTDHFSFSFLDLLPFDRHVGVSAFCELCIGIVNGCHSFALDGRFVLNSASRSIFPSISPEVDVSDMDIKDGKISGDLKCEIDGAVTGTVDGSAEGVPVGTWEGFGAGAFEVEECIMAVEAALEADVEGAVTGDVTGDVHGTVVAPKVSVEVPSFVVPTVTEGAIWSDETVSLNPKSPLDLVCQVFVIKGDVYCLSAVSLDTDGHIIYPASKVVAMGFITPNRIMHTRFPFDLLHGESLRCLFVYQHHVAEAYVMNLSLNYFLDYFTFTNASWP